MKILTRKPQFLVVLWCLICAGTAFSAENRDVSNEKTESGMGVPASAGSESVPADSNWFILGSGVGGGTSPGVYSLLAFDGKLIVGGRFTQAGGIPVNNIASWDGTSWSSLGSGLVGGLVRDLIEFEGELVAAGAFFQTGDGASVAGIARWNGTSWQPMGGGVWKAGALEIFNGELVGACGCTTVGGDPSNKFAKWDGFAWQPFSPGLNYPATDIITFNNKLVVAGSFQPVMWDGIQWDSLQSPNDVWVSQSLTAYENKLAVGRRTAQFGNNVAVELWDGTSWTMLDSTMQSSYVNALDVYFGDLIAAGDFMKVGDTNANTIARWDGSAWNTLGSGIGGAAPFIPNNKRIMTLAVYDSGLVVGGVFDTAGVKPAGNIAMWKPPAPSCCDTPGDYNNDSSFNIADVTAGIARIFSGGAAPVCQDEADANGDNAFNVADVTYGIARIFSGGAAPICGASGT